MQKIITDINAYMRRYRGTNADWYIGIASNVKQRLFNDHSVSEKTDAWIYRQAISTAAAREVEKAYLDAGCDGGTGGGDDNTIYVYAYLKTPNTEP